MRFVPTSLPGVLVVEQEPVSDERGSFARAYCRREFAAQGIDFVPVQVSISQNTRRNTLRGLHLQAPPHEEAKLVRCTRGAVFDVAVDVRAGSHTFGCWTAVEISQENGKALYVPPGFAHGFQTLTEDSELTYLISAVHEPDAQRGVRWDDPEIGVEWPEAAFRVMSDRDRALPPLKRLRG